MDNLSQNNNAFAIELYKELSKTPGNLFFSPFSISAALAMTYAGACGETEAQMARVMHFDTDQSQFHPAFSELLGSIEQVQSENVRLAVANSIFPSDKYPFLRSFVETLRQNYRSEVTPLNYDEPEQARQVINQWVEDKTEQKIKDLIQNLSHLSRLVLVNAIYFKGDWFSKFEKEDTQDSDFWVTPDKKVSVPMMHQDAHFGYWEDGRIQALELPYIDQQLSMILILPKEKGRLDEIETALDKETVSLIVRALKARTRARAENVEVFIPRFKLECKFLLNETLISLGMGDSFDDKADFSGMNGAHDLKISKVIHQAVVDVNEEGTEVAAATVVEMMHFGISETPVFRADHPFIFLILEKSTGSILFMGRVTDPTA